MRTWISLAVVLMVPATAWPQEKQENIQAPAKKAEDVAAQKIAMQKIADHLATLDKNPADAAAFKKRGAAFARAGQWHAAIGDFSESLALDPVQADVYILRGLAEMGGTLEKYECPDKSLLQMIDKKAKKKDLFKSDYDRAVEDFDRALRIDERSAQAYYFRASARLEHWTTDKCLKEALKDPFEIIKRIDEKMKTAVDTRKGAKVKAAEAKKALERAKKTEVDEKKHAWEQASDKLHEALNEFGQDQRQANKDLNKILIPLSEAADDMILAIEDYNEASRLEPTWHASVQIWRTNAEEKAEVLKKPLRAARYRSNEEDLQTALESPRTEKCTAATAAPAPAETPATPATVKVDSKEPINVKVDTSKGPIDVKLDTAKEPLNVKVVAAGETSGKNAGLLVIGFVALALVMIVCCVVICCVCCRSAGQTIQMHNPAALQPSTTPPGNTAQAGT